MEANRTDCCRSRLRSSSSGGVFIEHKGPFEISPGVWLLGPVPRVHPERNFSTPGRVQTPAGPVEDNVPEDTAVVINAASGLIVISGCGHAGIVNTVGVRTQGRSRSADRGSYRRVPPLRRDRRSTGVDGRAPQGRRYPSSARRALHGDRSGLPPAATGWPVAARGGCRCGRLVLYTWVRDRGAGPGEIAAGSVRT